ncbi:TetR/AcrR family transcriptional regulator [Nocardia sp. NPDC057353]|uniref:TetR/AcrR family transcriptional regulator n=1 Tax=Nocardia sp. NPDC057353 TaxID=3346104 RepID=UPI003640DCC1
METAIEWTPNARKILVTAAQLFYDHGITAVGVDRIAAESGVTKRTLYDRFGSKERLVVEYLRARDAEWRALLDARVAAAGADPRARVGAIFDACAEWMRTRADKGCGMIRAHAELPPEHPGYAVVIGQKHWMRELFACLAADAGAPDPVATATTLLLLHEGALVCFGTRIAEDSIMHARAAALALLPGAEPPSP